METNETVTPDTVTRLSRLCAECSFDYSGKTYEYEVSPALVELAGLSPSDRTTHTSLYAITQKTTPMPEIPSPKEFGLVRVVRFKPYEEKEFSGDLKRLHLLFWA